MAEYEYKQILDLTYSVPLGQKPRKKAPPLVVVMNENCNCCAGSPVCQSECPVDCIHPIYDEGRPMRVYCDTSICIGCMNCFSYDVRPKNIIKGDKQANCDNYNDMDLAQKNGVCPWDAIEILPFDVGVERSDEFYYQPSDVPDGFTLEEEEEDSVAVEASSTSENQSGAAPVVATGSGETLAMSDDAAAHHGPSYSTIYFLLLFFTVITVGVAYVDFGAMGGVVVALTIATIKASLVALFFMHLKSEVRAVKVVIGFPIVLLIIMFVALLMERF